MNETKIEFFLCLIYIQPELDAFIILCIILSSTKTSAHCDFRDNMKLFSINILYKGDAEAVMLKVRIDFKN